MASTLRRGVRLALFVALFVPAPPARAATSDVAIRNGTYQPATTTVEVGDTVRWTNLDDVGHTATAPGEFDSGVLGQTATFSHTFTTPGTISYFCTLHQEAGRIVVRAAATTTSTTTTSTTSTTSTSTTTTTRPTTTTTAPTTTTTTTEPDQDRASTSTSRAPVTTEPPGTTTSTALTGAVGPEFPDGEGTPPELAVGVGALFAAGLGWALVAGERRPRRDA